MLRVQRPLVSVVVPSFNQAAFLPDALRWLWEGYPKPVTRSKEAHGGTPTVERHFITQILDPDSDWERVNSGHGAAKGLAIDENGDVFFAGSGARGIFKIDAGGKITAFKTNTGEISGLMFGPGGVLYAGQPVRQAGRRCREVTCAI